MTSFPRTTPNAPIHVLRFAASFLWADHRIEAAERTFFLDLARELGFEADAPVVTGLLDEPPQPEEIDPASVPSALAAQVRRAALRAIASDGEVAPAEMEMFFLLDELLPAGRGDEDEDFFVRENACRTHAGTEHRVCRQGTGMAVLHEVKRPA